MPWGPNNVIKRWQPTNDAAYDVVRDTAKFLGAGVANIINIFNPQVVVICGGVTLAGAKLFVPLRGEVKRRAFAAAAASTSTPATCQPSAAATPSAPPEPHPTSSSRWPP